MHHTVTTIRCTFLTTGRALEVECVKCCKLITGSHPLGATFARLAQTGRATWRRGGGCGVYPLGGPERGSGGGLQSLPLRLFQECHVEIAVILLPPLVLLDGEGR